MQDKNLLLRKSRCFLLGETCGSLDTFFDCNTVDSDGIVAGLGPMVLAFNKGVSVATDCSIVFSVFSVLLLSGDVSP